MRYQWVRGEGFVTQHTVDRLMKIIRKQLPTNGLCKNMKTHVEQAQNERLEKWINTLSQLPSDQQEEQIKKYEATTA